MYPKVRIHKYETNPDFVSSSNSSRSCISIACEKSCCSFSSCSAILRCIRHSTSANASVDDLKARLHRLLSQRPTFLPLWRRLNRGFAKSPVILGALSLNESDRSFTVDQCAIPIIITVQEAFTAFTLSWFEMLYGPSHFTLKSGCSMFRKRLASIFRSKCLQTCDSHAYSRNLFMNSFHGLSDNLPLRNTVRRNRKMSSYRVCTFVFCQITLASPHSC